MITTDTILEWLQGQVENKTPIGPHVWLDAAMKLTVLLGDEHDVLFRLQQEVAKVKLEAIESGDSVAKAKAKVEATDIFYQAKKQQAKIERVEEMVRLSKIQSRLKDNEMSYQWPKRR